MKNCKVVNGQLRCEEDSITNFSFTKGNTQTTDQTTEFGAVSPIGTVSNRGALPY